MAGAEHEVERGTGSGGSAPLRVLLVGAYGIENAGDDAALEVLAAALRAREPDVRLAVVARHPDPLMAAHLGVRYLPGIEHASREEAAGRWFRGLNPGDDPEPLERLSAEIRRADLVVAGAGNVLIDLTLDRLRGPIALLATYAFLADLHRTPFFLYGIGAGPLDTEAGRATSGWIARRSAAVTCRDAGSAELLAGLAPEADVRVLPDPVLGLAPAPDAALEALWRAEGIPPRGARPRLAVAVRDLDFLGEHRPLLVAALRELGADHELLFVPQSTYRDADDRLEAERLAAALPGVAGHRIQGRYPPSVLMRAYESADVTLAVRLHGAVFSALAGVPPVGLAYLPKVRAFLDELGRPELALDLDSTRPDELAAAVRRARAGGGAGLRRRCAELAGRVGEYADLACRLGRGSERDSARSAA